MNNLTVKMQAYTDVNTKKSNFEDSYSVNQKQGDESCGSWESIPKFNLQLPTTKISIEFNGEPACSNNFGRSIYNNKFNNKYFNQVS